MKEKLADVRHRQAKACICRFAPLSRLFLRPTGKRNPRGLQEVRCGMWRRTAYV